MAIMVKVDKRGTDFKKNFRIAVKTATKKLRWYLTFSIIVNLVLSYLLFRNN